MADRPDDETRIGVTAFKGRCLALIDEVARGKTGRVVLTRRDRPVAGRVPVGGEAVELWGALRGAVTLAPGADLTAPTGERWAAER